MIERYLRRVRSRIARWRGYDDFGIARLEPLNGKGLRVEEFCGWPMVRGSTAERWYCIGVGEDATFEKELLRREPTEVWLFDPTPRSTAYIRAEFPELESRFRPWGVWNEDGPKSFYAPANKAHVSHSIVDLQSTGTVGFTADCYTVESIMKRLGHSRVDAIKIDAEGAGIPILNTLMESRIRPTQILIEFDEIWAQSAGWRQSLAAVCGNLRKEGYGLVAQRGCNYVFFLMRSGG